MSKFEKPSDARAAYAVEKKENDDKYAEENRLYEGKKKGKILSITEEVSRNDNSMYVIEIRTKGNDGKKLDIKKICCKHLKFQMEDFYDLIELAGFNIDDISTQNDLDKILEIFEEETPKVEFECKHQKKSNYNDYIISKCDNLAEVTEDEADEAEAEVDEDEVEEEVVDTKAEKAAAKKAKAKKAAAAKKKQKNVEIEVEEEVPEDDDDDEDDDDVFPDDDD